MSMKLIVAGAKPLRSSTSRIEAAIFENAFISAFVYESGAGASFAAGAEAGGGASVLVGTPGETERSTTVGRADSESEEDDSAPGTEVVGSSRDLRCTLASGRRRRLQGCNLPLFSLFDFAANPLFESYGSDSGSRQHSGLTLGSRVPNFRSPGEHLLGASIQLSVRRMIGTCF